MNSPYLNYMDYSVWEAEGVSSQNFRHWSAEASSAKQRHTDEPSNWPAAKTTDDGHKDKRQRYVVMFGLTIMR